MLDLVVLHHAALGDDLFQKDSKPRNVPLAVAEFIKESALGVLEADLEGRLK
jgi:hypothetical protein